MSDDLEGLLRAAEEHARRVMIGTKTQLAPAWVLMGAGEALIIVTPWDTERDKRLVEAKLKGIIKERGITSYSFVSEAWIARRKSMEEAQSGPLPSQDPEREERVFAFACDGRNKLARGYKIERDYAGRCRELTLDYEMGEPGMMGWTASLLDGSIH
jgi:hypothetical protein